MKPIEFKEQDLIIAKDQDEYLPLPAHLVGDPNGCIIFCWKMTIPERLKLLLTGILWQEVLTFNTPLQPQRLSTRKPVMICQKTK